MIHILTAFSRRQNLDFYLEHLKNLPIVWHPILFGREYTVEMMNILRKYPFIQPCVIQENIAPVDLCYYKLNAAMDTIYIPDDDKVLFMNDDDWFDPAILSVLDSLQNEVIFISMYRGHNFQGGHPVTPLFPSANVGIGTIGLQQLIIDGDVAKKERFNVHNGCADGEMALNLLDKYKVHFAPELFAYFNYLEPGRWNL